MINFGLHISKMSGEETVCGTADVEGSAVVSDDWRHAVLTKRQCRLRMLERGVLTDCVFVVGPENGETQVKRNTFLSVTKLHLKKELSLLQMYE